jgi:N-methylhydantoinase A
MEVEIVNWRVTAQGGTRERIVKVELAGTPAIPKGTRSVFIGEASHDVAVYDRRALALGQIIAGPVIVEERETTVFVLPGWTLTIVHDGALVATRD